ncbi:MAG: hypothetical protein NC084_04235 [Bacteroides sp.]|nr:hypothetical protein [Eubacterium sp.]MCM1417928.1 hypothetical protein [Roseburia sp.]MCM1461909.1 hypothetical protein [Bacteroides sp.]
MKKTYKAPEALISLFDTKDVITASDQETATTKYMTNAGELKDDYSDGNYDSIFGA